jgi:hypothetical protein
MELTRCTANGIILTMEPDPILLFRAKRRGQHLTRDQRVALDLLKRRGVSIPVLMKVFNCSRTIIYYKRKRNLTGKSKVDVTGEAQAMIRKLGVEGAWQQFVTKEMIDAVDRENKLAAQQHEERLAQRREEKVEPA